MPLLFAALWFFSGRERLTKREKIVELDVLDDTFGDRITRVESRRGPVLGYFIGLDAVVIAAAAGIAIGGVGWWIHRRHARSSTVKEN